jgi:hypothetical protein
MKKTVILSLPLLLAAATHLQAQTTIAQWTFEASVPGGAGVTATSIGGILPEVGGGVASGLHASASTVWNNPVGNGSLESFSANNWAVGDYFQFQTSTLGLSQIAVAFDHVSSSTGPRDFNLAWSTDGSSFFNFGSHSVLVNTSPYAWSSSTAYPVHNYSYDLSSITLLDNAPNVYFRIVDASTVSAGGGTVAAAGTSRVDNFTVSSIPEPAAVAMLGLGLAGLILFRRRR